MNARSLLSITVLALAQTACAPYPPPYRSGPPPENRGGFHPAYEHAQSDLLAARDAVAQRPPENQRIAGVQRFIVQEISAALSDLHRADFADGKDQPIPPPDLDRLPPGNLHAAEALVRRARGDVGGPEQNPRAIDAQQRALGHIDEALRMLHDAIGELGDS